MSLTRSASTSSAGSDGVSSVNSSKSGAPRQAGGADKDEAVDILEQGQSMETALFGVLFTMSKEKFDSSPRLAVLKLILDFIQFFLLIVRPQYGWDLNTNSWMWQAVSWITFVDPLLQKGYNFYIGVQLTIAALLLLSLLLCVWVGYCFKNDHFPYLWPIKILRVVVATFVVVFYIASLSIFMVDLNCNWFVAGPTQFHLHAYPEVACFTSPNVIYFVISLISAITFVLIAYCMTIADFDLNPLNKRLLSSPQTLVEVRNLFARTVMVITASQLYGQPNLQSIIFFLLTFFLFWSFVRWQPNYNPWINHVRSGIYASLTWASILLIALTNGDSSGLASYRTMVTQIMAYGILPIFVFGFAASFIRLLLLNRALRKFKDGDPGKDQIRDVYRFNNPSEAEIISRCCRRYLPEDDEVLDPKAVKTGELVVRVGMALFPQDFFMVLTYSSFLLEVEHNWQSGASQLQQARKFAKTLSDKFAIFVREQEQKQRSQTQNSGESGTDLVSYVEFQRNTALVARYHSSSLHNIKNFWKLLLHNEVSFTQLVGCFGDIESSKLKCERAYKMILDRYPSSVKLMRSYVQFLEEVKNDPWAANKYSKLADKIEADQENADNNDLLMNDSGIGMSARNSGVCCINATGTIEMVNKQLLKMFGYKKGELEGKNVSVLMPPPFSQRHNNFLKAFISTGKAKILDSVRDVVGVHKERQLIPMKICVSKVSGSGIDSIFMGLLQSTEEDPNVVKVLMMPQGIVIVVDERFQDWFGKGPAECTGKHVSTLVSEQETITRLLEISQTANEEEFKAGSIASTIHILHKFVAPVRVNIQFDLGGTEGQRLLIMQIRMIHKGEDNMMVTDQRGRVIFMNNALRTMLEFKPKQLRKLDLSKLMPPPFSVLHQRWMKDQTPKVPLQSCRKGATVLIRDSKGTLLPVRALIGLCGSVENPQYSIHVESSSWEKGLDDRRMSLVLDEEGMVQGALGATPDSLFGFEPSSLVGMTLEAFINVFSEITSATSKPKDAVVSDLFSRMITRASERPGYSWRVGVHPVTTIDVNASSMSKMISQAVLLKNTKAALMQLEVREPEAEGEVRVLRLHVWRADMVSGIVEIDHDTAITNPMISPIHPSGLIFGHPDKKLRRQRLRNLLHLPGSHGEDLLKDHKKKNKAGTQAKGAMKMGTTGRKLGPSMVVTGRHIDGAEIKVRVQAVAKDSKHISVKINFEELDRGNPETFKSTLYTDEEMRLEAAKNGAVLALEGRGEAEEYSDQSSDEAGGKPKSFMSAADDEEEEEEEEEEEVQQAVAKAAAEEDALNVVDFKRAVRYRKLCALLSSRAARLDLLRYLTHMRIILIVLLVVHTACFTALLVSIDSLSSYLQMIDSCAKSSYMLQRVMIYCRMLSNIHLNKVNLSWYSSLDLPNILHDFAADINSLETAHQSIFFGTGSKPTRLPSDFDLDTTWENHTYFPQTQFFDVSSSFFVTGTNSLWDVMNGVIAHARELLQNHAYISNVTNGNITNHHDWQFVLMNGVNAGTAGYRESTDAITSVTMAKVDQIYTVAISLLIVEGVFFCVGAAIWSLWMFLAVLKRRYTLFSVFFVVPSALLKSLATKKLSVDDEDDDMEDEDIVQGDAVPANTMSSVKPGLSVKTHKGGTGGTSPPPLFKDQLKSLWATLKGGLLGSKVEVGKKFMKQDSKDTYLLTLPLIFWGFLIIGVYAYSYVTLKSAGVPLISMNVAGRVLVKSARSIFAAHELVSQETDDQKIAHKALLLARRNDLYSYYEGLLYGSDGLSGLSFGPVPSTLFEPSGQPAYLFFKEDQCFEGEYPSLYCYGNTSDPYYQVSHHALDPMIIRLMDELLLLISDALPDININSKRMDYVWDVAYHSMVKGLFSSAQFYSDQAISYFNQVRTANIVLFSLSWVLAAAFYFGIISPFVIRLGKESVQVAELLSQLPEDLDAEGLVKSMMMDQRQRGSSSKKEERRRSSLVMAPPLSPIKSGRTSIEIAGPPLALDQGIGRRGNRRVSVENT